LITKNIFLPVFSLYLHDAGSVPLAVNASQSLMPSNGSSSLQSILTQFLPGIPKSPVETIGDLAGIFFYPATGNASITALIPLFMVMVIIAGIFVACKKIQFFAEEKKFISLFLLISIAVFLAYARTLHILNTEYGIVPDIRYLSPVYLPLMMIGLIILKKTDLLPENPADSIKRLILVCSGGLAILVLLLPLAYAPSEPFPLSTLLIRPLLGKFFSIYTLVVVLLALGTILYSAFIKRKSMICEYLVYLLCSLPLFWQVNEILELRTFSGFAGHIFWIPVMRVFWDLIVRFIFLKNVIP